MSQTSHPSSAAPVGRPMWTLIGPGLGAMLAGYQFGLLLVLHQTVQREFGFSVAAIVVVVAAHVIGAAAGFAPGYLLGRRAPTSVVVPAVGLMLIGAVMAMLSGSPVFLIVAALLTGLGGGAVLGAAIGLTGQVDAARRGAVRLALGLAVAVGFVFGPVLGWLIMSMLSWRLPYLLALPLAVAALLATAASGVIAVARPPITDRRG